MDIAKLGMDASLSANLYAKYIGLKKLAKKYYKMIPSL